MSIIKIVKYEYLTGARNITSQSESNDLTS